MLTGRRHVGAAATEAAAEHLLSDICPSVTVYRFGFRPLSYIFYGVSLAGISCHRRWPPPTTLAMTTSSPM